MLRRFLTVVAVSLLGIGLTLPFGDHRAMAAFNECSVGEVCWWDGANYSGPWGHRTGGNIGIQGCWSMGSVGNTASSFRTRLSAPYRAVIFHDGGSPTGCYGWTMQVGTAQYGTFAEYGSPGPGTPSDNWLGGISVW